MPRGFSGKRKGKIIQSNDRNSKFHGSSQLEGEIRQAAAFKRRKNFSEPLRGRRRPHLLSFPFKDARVALSRLSDRSRSYQRDALYYFLPARIYPDQPLSSLSRGRERERKKEKKRKRKRNEICGIRENKLHKYRL